MRKKINASLQILYLPGGILITVCIITFIVHRMSLVDISNAIKDSTKTILGARFVLIFTVPLVRIMINSGINEHDIVSMPIAMAQGMSSMMGQIYQCLHQQLEQLVLFLLVRIQLVI